MHKTPRGVKPIIIPQRWKKKPDNYVSLLDDPSWGEFALVVILFILFSLATTLEIPVEMGAEADTMSAGSQSKGISNPMPPPDKIYWRPKSGEYTFYMEILNNSLVLLVDRGFIGDYLYDGPIEYNGTTAILDKTLIFGEIGPIVIIENIGSQTQTVEYNGVVITRSGKVAVDTKIVINITVNP